MTEQHNNKHQTAHVRGFRALQVQWDAFLQDLDNELHLGANALDVLPTARVSPETALISATTGRYALDAFPQHKVWSQNLQLDCFKHCAEQ